MGDLEELMSEQITSSSFISSKDIVNELELDISSSTVRKRLLEKNLRSCMPSKKPMLTKKHLKKRLDLDWTISKWRYSLLNSDGVCHVRRPKGKWLHPRYSKATIKHGGSNVMIWTCFSASGVGPFVEIQTKMDRFVYRNILASHMLNYAEWEIPLRWAYQHDNDPKHSSKFAKNWLSANGVQVLDWPPQSPDLNSIENLFGILKRTVGTRRFKNRQELMNCLKSEWEAIPTSVLSNPMPKRCAEIARNNGHHIKY